MLTFRKTIAAGFTLIELMIVVAIVGVLAAIALPVYQDYLARSQVAEAYASAGSMKTALTTFFASQGTFPPAGQFDDTLGGRYTQSLTHDVAGVITLTMRSTSPVNQRIQGTTSTMTPTVSADSISDWNCSALTINIKYLPSGCQ